MQTLSALTAARARVVVVTLALILSACVAVLWPPAAAHADDHPDPGTPATVTADALPTVQQNGVVWNEVTVGNIVYATGSFTQAWPAGVTQGGAGTVTRNNLLAFDITTGNLVTSFNHSLNAQGLWVTASPDGSRVYVGGDFTTVDGVSRNHIAAFDTATGALDTSFHPSISAEVTAIAATNSAVYVGGKFFSANGVSRTRLAAFTPSNGALLSWAPTADDNFVSAMVMAPDGSRVIVGGRFSTLNGVPAYGMGAVDATTGATLPWAINQTVQDYGDKCGILSLTTDGTNIYGSGFAFGCGNFEGTFAADPDTGNIVFVNDCHGDTYGTFSTGQVLYSVSHAHECSAIGDFPDTNPRVWHHALAFTTYPTGTNVGPDDYGWNYNGVPDAGLLHWFPALGIGTYTGQNQAAWSVTGNSQYLALGGEFPTANGKSQHGLVRYAVSPIAPDKVGPVGSSTLTPSVVSLSSGTARVAWQATWDYDNANLTYNVLRDGVQVYTTTQSSNFWQLPSMGFVDTGLAPGSTHSYRIQVVDPDGNKLSGGTTSVTITSSSPSTYAQDVLHDGASDYWRLGEPSGTTAYDWAGFSDLTEGSGVGHGHAGAIIGDSDNASTFDGTDNGQASTTSPVQGPNTFTLEAWINTTTTSGGKIAGFGNSTEGTASSSYDRHIYMDNSGHVIFGVYNNGTYTITSSNTYNDGQWHQIVGTLSSSGMVLYIDGKKVGTNGGTTVGQPYQGYWRIGGDNLNGWPSQPSSNDFNGAIDEVAVYPAALTLAQVQKHYTDSGRTLNIPPPPTDAYGQAVYNDNPDLYWRLDEGSGATAYDATPNGDNGTYQGGITYQVPSTVTGPTGTGAGFNGSNALVVASQQVNDPTVYTEELWFNTTTTSGGKLIGFGDATSGNSSNYDRHVYMLNSGQLLFGVWTGTANTITSPNSYNDGKWHYLVAEQGPDGMKLYVDDSLVGTNPQTQAQSYSGYWRIGGDNTWGGASSNYFAGSLDEVAVYSTELTAAQIQAHWRASAAAVNQPPVASFTPQCNGTACSFDGSASYDPDGSVAGYSWTFGDGATATGATPTHTYAATGQYTVTLTVTDDQGAQTSTSQTIDVKPLPADAYGRAVLADNPTIYWRLDESGGTTAADASIYDNNGTYSGGVTYQVPSPVTGANGTGVGFDGSSGGVGSQASFNDPTVYSEEVWFNTTTTAGGKLIGFGDQSSGLSGNYDRHVYMTPSGQLNFGVWTGSENVITSPNSYNDGQWHQVVATQGPDGMKLYVDGALVGTNPQTQAQDYTGYWRIGGDSDWDGAANYFAGTLDEAAVYSHELTASQVAAHFNASSVVPVQNPTAAFTASCTKLSCSFDASTSTDPNGGITSYAWDFGDGTTGTGVSPTHAYNSGATYNVTLTVSDAKGGTATVSHDVTAVANVPPTAAFTDSCNALACSFDGSGSTDPDGTVTQWAWDFGDGTTATGTTPSHTYAASGSYTVQLTVTDNDGATNSVSHSVSVTAAPNQPPVAAFTSSCTALACSFDGSGSTDPDGTVAQWAWNFGDGTSGTGSNPGSHTYPAAGDYTVTLTVTDNQGATNSVSHVVSPRPPANPPTTPWATDGFNRTVSNGWGTADTGGAWTVTGTKSNYAVSGGTATMKLPTPGSFPSALLGSVSTSDTDTTLTLSSDKTGTGLGIYMYVIGRHVATNAEYRARVRLLATNKVAISVLVLNGTSTQTLIGPEITLPGITYAPGMQLNVRFQVTGTSPTTLRLKVWPTGSTEPTTWQINTTDNSSAVQAAGSVGVTNYLSSTATNAPVTVSLSNFASRPTVAPPTAAFTANCTSLSCSVDASASTDPSGTISSYQWSWADGTVTTGVTSSHTYTTAGTYRITLTVTDPSGWTDVTTQTVTVA